MRISELEPGLPADRPSVEHGRAQALRGAVDGGREPGRTGAHHDEIGLVRLELGRKAERPRQLGGAGIREHAAVGEGDGRLRRIGLRLEPMRDPEARDRGPERMGASRAGLGDDRGARRSLTAQPRRLLEQLGDRPVKDLVGARRRPEHVEVDPAARHALEDELGELAIEPTEPGDQEPSPGRGMQRTDAGEELGAALPGREHDRHLVPVAARFLDDRHQLVVRAAADRVVGAVSPLELVGHAAALRRVVVGDHEQRLPVGWRHGGSAVILRPSL